MKNFTRISFLSLLFLLGTVPLLKAQTQTHTSPGKAHVVNSFPYYHKLTNSSGGGTPAGMGGSCHTIGCCSVWVYRVDIPVAGSIRIDNLNFTALAGSLIAYKANKKNPSAMSDITYVSGQPGNFCGFRDTLQLGYRHTWSRANRTTSQNASLSQGWRSTPTSADTIGPGSYYILAWSKNNQVNLGTDSATFVFRFAPYCGGTTGRTCPPSLDITGNDNGISNGSASASLSNNTLLDSTSIYSAKTITYSIENSLDSFFTLDGTNPVSIGGPGASYFSVISQPNDRSIDDDDSTTFQIKYSPTNIGSDTAIVKIANSVNDTFTFTVVGNALDLRPIVFAQKFEGTTADNWNYTPDPAKYATETDSVIAGSEDIWDIIREFTGDIDNPYDGKYFWGTQDLKNNNGGRSSAHHLNFDNVYVGGLSDAKLKFNYYSDGFDGSDKIYYQLYYDNVGQGIVNVEKNSDEWLTVRHDIPSTVDSVKFVWSAYNDGSADYSGFDGLEIRGTGGPSISVIQSGTTIANGNTSPSSTDSTHFGYVIPNSKVTVSYYVKSQGSKNLTLSGSPKVAISGTNASDFKVITQPSSTITPGNTSLFQIEFAPTTGGNKVATVTIAHNDTNQTAYAFSLLGIGQTAITAGDVVITEISYNPPESGSDSTEFIELYNSTSSDIKLLDWKFSAGVVYTFPDVVIPANGYFVSAADSSAVNNRYGITTTRQWRSGGLSNGGEPIVLKDQNNNTIDSLRYDDAAPWPAGTPSPDGGGPTIALCNPNADNTVGSNWIISQSRAFNSSKVNGKIPYGSAGSADSSCNTSSNPEIAVLSNGIEIASGNTTTSATDSTVFGSVDTNTTSLSVTYYVKNSGTASLTLNGSPKVSISGTNASEFTVTTQPSGSIASGDSSAFVVSFLPTDVGARTANVTISNNDSDEGSYTFAIAGTGSAIVVLPPSQCIGLGDTLDVPVQAAWLSGTTTRNANAWHGTKGTASMLANPQSIQDASSWVDTTGNFYVFGGYANVGGTLSYFNTFWKWDGTNWTWISGDSTANSSGVYGTKGIASSSNIPGGRSQSATWVDRDNNFWLFGGYGYDKNGDRNRLNDLWKWDGTNWTWMSGSDTKDADPVYGTTGVANSTNVPGATFQARANVLSNGHVYVYGGSGNYNSGTSTGSGPKEELWKWDGTNWTFVRGEKNALYGTYGQKGVTTSTSHPGSRQGHFQWIDCNDNLWVFGGSGRDYGSGDGLLSDMWKFDGTNWTWIHGDTVQKTHPVYSSSNKGVSDVSYNPGGRSYGVSFRDNDGSLWLWGGVNDNRRSSQARTQDMWRWSDTAWTWMGGAVSANQQRAVTGTKGVSSTSNWPGGKGNFAGAHDPKSGTLYMFGGYGYESSSFGWYGMLWGLSAGEAPAPKIHVFGKGTRITNGQTATSFTDSTDFGTVNTMSTDSIRFMVANPGTQYLSFNQFPRLTITGTHASDFSFDENMIGGVSAGDTGYFKIYFSPADTGDRFANISWKTNTGPINDTFSFNIKGRGNCPVVNPTNMEVYAATYPTLYNGDTASTAKQTTLDAASAGNTSSRTFYIKNTGSTNNLVLANTSISDLYGVFSLTASPSASVSPGDSTSFTVEFAPSTQGAYSGEISFSSNTCPDSVFTFAVQGTAACNNSGTQWEQVGSTIYETEGSGYFGREVDISEDGQRIVVGTPSHSNSTTRELGYGQMFEYDSNTKTWKALGKPVTSLSIDTTGSTIRGNRDGTSITISGNGERMAVGGRDHRYFKAGSLYGYMLGGVNVYEYDANQDSMVQVGQRLYGGHSNDRFGWDVEMSKDGNTLLVGAQYGDSLFTNSGYIRIYDLVNNKWVLRGEAISGTTKSDEFGTSVAISADGNTVAAGADYNDDNASNSGHARIFTWSGTAWVQKGSTLVGEFKGDDMGRSISLSANGNIVAVGEDSYDFNDQVSGADPGRVRIFEFKNNDWSLMGNPISGTFDGTNNGDDIGVSVALSNSGKRAVVGAPDRYDPGAAKVYDYKNGDWYLVGCELIGEESNDDFGYDVAISGNGSTILVGNEMSSSKDSAYVKVFYYDNSPKISLAVDSNVTCNGLANGGASATVTQGTAPFQFSWSNGDTTLFADSLSAGTYRFTVIDAAQDTVVDSVVITEPAALVASSVVDDNVSCNSLSDGGATASATGGTTPYSYAWSNAATTVSITSVSAGAYSVTITDANGCTATANSTITEPAALQTTTTVDSNVTCNGLSDGGLTTAGSGGTTSYTYLWSNAGTTAGLTSLSAGTYTVTVTDANGCTATDQETVTEPAILSISTVVDSNVTCNGLMDGGITASNSGGTTPYSYTWSNSASTASVTNLLAGTYTLTVTDANGCTTSSSKTVTQPALLAAGLIDGDTTVCSGTAPNKLRVLGTTSGGVGNYTYQWQMSTDSANWSNVNGATSVDYQPQAVAGNSWYRRLDSDGNICGPDTTNVLKVGVFAQPNAGFRATTACEGKQTVFTDTTTLAFGKIQSYFWSFGDQGTSNQQNPINIYKNSGTYTVKLDIVADGGCNSSVTKTVSVNDMPSVDFSATSECEGTATSFTNKSSINSGSNAYSWDLGDNNSSTSTSPSHSYTNSGYYTVQLTATSNNGCVDSISKTVQVKQVAKPNFSATSECEGETTNFTNLSTNANTYSWDFGDKGNGSKQANPKNKYKNSGSYTVVLTATSADGCSDTAQRTVSVYALPTASFSGTEVCQGQSTVFTNTSTGASKYQWIFDNGTSSTATAPSLVYGQAGNYKVELTATTANGCVDVASNTITVNTLPEVSFTAADICLSEDLATTNTTTGANQYAWSFGDGNTSALRTPSHTYTSHGQYEVKLVARSSKGCVSIDSTDVNVYAVPAVSFTATNECFGVSTQFTNSSRIADGTMTYVWTLGNGTTTGNPSPSYRYGSDGNYNIKLVATSNNGCKDSTTGSVDVFAMPTVDFTTASVCYGDTLFTNNLSSTANYNWSFDDGNTSTDASPFNNYKAAGNYTIQLIATTSNNCVDSMSTDISIYAKPIADFEVKDVCDEEAVQFANTSYNAIITGNNWDFGDGNSDNRVNPNNLYASEGGYTTTLIVISNEGCSDTVSKALTVHPNPVMAFTNTTECDYDATVFTDGSSITSGTINYTWDFGTGDVSAIASPTYQYAGAGAYKATLTGTSDQGCIKEASAVVVVNPSPMASIRAANNCEGLNSQFASLSTVDAGGITDYSWDFGDANASTDQSPTHLYGADGSYTVELVVMTDQSCYDTATSTITIWNKPTANFNTPDICFGGLSVFADGSTDANEYLYDFGDKWGISTLGGPEYTYEAPGTYDATLFVTSSNGCKDTVTKSIVIYSLPQARFTVNNHCFGEDFQPQDQSQGSVDTWTWEYEDGNTSTDQSPTHQYGKDGRYNVKLQVEDNNGCTDSLRKTVVVWPLPVVGIRTDTLVSKGYTVPMLATGGVEYKWSPVDNLDKPLKANPTAIVVEDQTYTVTVANQFGCTRDTFVNLKVREDYTLEPSNIMTPDGNGQNDAWIVEKAQYYNDVEVIVFDRWGRIVYQSNSYNNSWEGTGTNGEQLPDGAYYYVVKVPAERDEYKGSITIFR